MKLNVLVCLLALTQPLSGQTLDIGTCYASGKYRGMAGAGIAITDDVSGMDLNPAGWVHSEKNEIALSQNVLYHMYDLYRHNQGQRPGYYADDVMIFEWSNLFYRFGSCCTGVHLNRNLALGIGYFNRISPFLYNQCRATTHSDLFNQYTHGAIGTYLLTFSIRMFDWLSLGLSLNYYSGKVESKIDGTNHGYDTDKWANMTNHFSGYNCKIGVQIRIHCLSAGVIFEPSAKLKVKANTSLSDDELYAIWLPDYTRTEWKTPAVLGFGIGFTGLKKWMFSLDVENRQYKKSDVQFNLYEYGAPPNWNDMTVFRAGIEYNPGIPIRLGYAYIPQLYASSNATGNQHYIVDYENTNQVIKHMFTAGTTLYHGLFGLNIGLEWSFLSWVRDLDTNFFIHDEYSENILSLFIELFYFIN